MTTLSKLTLVKATPEQAEEACRASYVQWARGMSMEEYLQRHRIVSQQEYSANGRLITWVLVPRDDPTSLNFLCGCETYRRTGVVAKPGHEKAQHVACYGIASVFTPPPNRGNGYASHMMRLLHWTLAPPDALPDFPSEWGTPPPNGPHDAQFSALYSDIGSDFYHNCGPTPGTKAGWETLSPISTSWKVEEDSTIGLSGFNSEDWTMLTKEDAEEIWKVDSAIMAREVLATSQVTGKTVYSFLPHEGVAQSNIQRMLPLTPDLIPISDGFWGMKCRLGGVDEDAYVTWTFEPLTKTIVLTRVRVSAERFPHLLQKLREVAKTMDEDTIEVWNISAQLQAIAEQAGGTTVRREEHLSAAKWYGAEGEDSLLWLFNEKFCWC